MESFLIPCPECGRELRLRDRALLGRNGRCPSCDHVFRLSEPETVSLELADAEPPMGTAPKWVPEESSGAPKVEAPPEVQDLEPQSLGVVETSSPSAPSSTVSRMQELKARRKRGNKTTIWIATAISVLSICVVAFWKSRQPEQTADASRDDKPASKNRPDSAEPDVGTDGEAESKFTPTFGNALSLKYLPAGIQVVFHVRPADLWAAGGRAEEVRFGLGPLAEFVAERIREICRREPEQIAEALIGLIIGPVGTEPEVVAVVHLAEPAKRADLIVEFGERIDDYDFPVFVDEENAFLIVDDSTFAVAPRDYAAEMVDALEVPFPAAPAIDELLVGTDKERHFSLLFQPTDIRLHQETLFAPLLRDLVNSLLDLVGDDVEGVAWSWHLGDPFFWDIRFRNRPILHVKRLKEELQSRLDELPYTVWRACEKMDPEKRGPRRIIGRFPAMLKVVALTTTWEAEDRTVTMRTVLPERSAPNLAVGGLLTWDESTRTDFTVAATTPQKPRPRQTKSMAQRLDDPIDVEFRLTPLEEAFETVASESNVKLIVEWKELEKPGYTRNMQQSFAVEKTATKDVLKRIVEQYELMCVCMHPDGSAVHVLTKEAAAERKWSVLLP